MAYENVKNYTEQGGEVTRIGGRLVIESEGSIEGLPEISNQAASTAATVATLKDDMNSLLNKLKDSGYMVLDTWPTVSVAKLQAEAGEDHKAVFEANMALVSSVSISNGVITVNADVDSMTAYESAAGYGEHKWIGLLITTGFSSIVGMKLNDSALAQSDAEDATRHSGSAGDLVLYFGAEVSNGKVFRLWHTGSGEKEFTINIASSN